MQLSNDGGGDGITSNDESDDVLSLLPSSPNLRAAVNITRRRTVTPLRDGSGELILPPKEKLEKLTDAEVKALKASGGTPYTTYQIECAQVVPVRKSWRVERRYKQFVALDVKLRRLGITFTKNLPPKSILRSMDAAFLDKRQEALSTYLQQLMPLLRKDPRVEIPAAAQAALRDFLLPSAMRMLMRMRESQRDLNALETKSSVCSNDWDEDSISATDSPRQTGAGSPNFDVPGVALSSPSSTSVGADTTTDAVLAATRSVDDASLMAHTVAVVCCGSHILECSTVGADHENDRSADTSSTAPSSTTNEYLFPLRHLNDLVTIIYKDGCYTYVRARLLVKRASTLTDNVVAEYPVRFQGKKVGTVRISATIEENEQLRRNWQLQMAKPKTYGSCGICAALLFTWISTTLLLSLVAVASLMGYALFRPLNRTLRLRVNPANRRDIFLPAASAGTAEATSGLGIQPS